MQKTCTLRCIFSENLFIRLKEKFEKLAALDSVYFIGLVKEEYLMIMLRYFFLFLHKKHVEGD